MSFLLQYKLSKKKQKLEITYQLPSAKYGVLNLLHIHTELMGVIIIFSDIPDMFKIVSLWSHLKVFSGIEKNN